MAYYCVFVVTNIHLGLTGMPHIARVINIHVIKTHRCALACSTCLHMYREIRDR